MAMSSDCCTNQHKYCFGCSCICHWDEVLIRYFARLGRVQEVEKILPVIRPNSEPDMGITLAKSIEEYMHKKRK